MGREWLGRNEEEMATLDTKVKEALSATSAESDEVKAAAVAAAIQGPDSKTANVLWVTLVVGLTLGVLAALGGILFAVMDGNAATGTDVIVTAFTALLTGVLGLFIKSPLQASGS